MAVNVITKPPTSFNIKTSASTPFNIQTVPSGVRGGGLSGSVQSATPNQPNVGDLWFDTGAGQQKVYDGASWDILGLVDHDNDGRFEFESTTTGSTLTTGLIAAFRNNTTDVFTISFDGILQLKKPASIPQAVDGGLYRDDDNLYFGVSS